MKFATIIIIVFISLIIISSCAPQIEKITNQLKKAKEINETKELECCIGADCGENECGTVQCPFECCNELIYEKKDCIIGECVNNKCIITLEEKNETKLSETIIYVTPENVKAGSYLTVVMIPGEKGASEKLIFYDEANNRKGNYLIRCGTGSYECFTKVRQTYKTSSAWQPGRYYVKVLDLGTNKYVKSYFNITD